MIVRIDDLKTVASVNAREHWSIRARRTKAERTAALLMLRANSPTVPSGRVVVTLTRVAGPQGRALDDDNLRSALKAARDGVADWLGCNDNDPRVKWEYAQEKAKRWAVKIEIRVAA